MRIRKVSFVLERSLIQTIGRAARHVEGVALLYADNMTELALGFRASSINQI